MTRQILTPKVLGVMILAITIGVIFGIPIIPMSASAEGEVPDWFKGVAGFWAEEKITTAEFLDGVEFLIDQKIIQVPGFVQAADAEGVDQATISDLWTAINNMQSQINDIQTNGGGAQGPPGPEGPPGPKGDSGIYNTYVRINDQNIEDHQGAFTVEANCEPGDVAMGGGGASTQQFVVSGSTPGDPNSLQNDDTPNSWEIYYLNPDKIAGVAISYVVCADITP